jgi:plastocyanin|tara:strand:- start:175 stop:582 length:408 start_codon:yes stop_codon:yes gene_type:complete
MKKVVIGLLVILVLLGCQPVAETGDHAADDHDDTMEDTADAEDTAGGDDAAVGGAAPSDADVRMGDTSIDPTTLTVSAGSSVTFVNTGSKSMKLTGDILSDYLEPAERHEETFEEAGSYRVIVIPTKRRVDITVE